MNFSDKYISDKENCEKPDPKKTVLSNDAYAIGSIIQELIKIIEKIGVLK